MKTFIEMPVIGNFIRQIDQDVEKYSFQGAMKNVVKRSRSKLVIKGKDKEVEEILKSKFVVLVANHPNDAEVLALIASLPERKDINLVINARMLGIIPHLDKHLIPAYIDHHFNPRHHNPLLSYLLRTFHSKSTFTPQQEHELNKKSISEAAKRVSDGGLVIIFPGRRSLDDHWFTGVGHLLKQTERNKKVYIMRVFIQGTFLWDYLRIIPGTGYFLPTVTITFAKPMKLSDVWDDNPKNLTTNIENKFNEWVKVLQNKTNVE